MFDSQLLFGGGGGGTVILGPWMPRQADNARFTVDVTAISGATLTVELLQKNTEDTGDGGDAETIASTSAVGQTTTEISAVEELVRYRYTVTDAASKWVLFRMLEPVWFDSVS